MIGRLRIRGRLAAAGAVCALGLVAAEPAAADPVTPITAQDCDRAPGVSQPSTSWALQRLDAAKVAQVTEGRNVRTGAPIRVAVIDSGLDDSRHPQLKGIDLGPRRDAIPDDPGRKFDDCYGHGTQVTAIIAAQHSTSVPGFFGLAPEVKIIPIKLTNGQDVASADVARAIDIAVDERAQIANLSLSIGNDPRVEAAVARARRAGMLIVAAAGNDNTQANRTASYPAKYSATYDNVVAVAATADNDAIADFSDVGSYVDVAAPGKDVQSVGVYGGYRVVTGTSFATPYVSATAALVLAANPGLSPAQLRARLEDTADPPPESVPSQRYGYGIVNPYLAVTSVRTDATVPHASSTPAALHLGVPPPEPDRTLQHVALGAGFGLLGLAALVITGAAVLRAGRGRRRRA